MDKYDDAINKLSCLEGSEFSHAVHNAWNRPFDDSIPGSCLFTVAKNKEYNTSNSYNCGCLTQIRMDPVKFRAQTASLTIAIKNDERIPKDAFRISKDNLYVFAEWQRRIDKELNRV